MELCLEGVQLVVQSLQMLLYLNSLFNTFSEHRLLLTEIRDMLLDREHVFLEFTQTRLGSGQQIILEKAHVQG